MELKGDLGEQFKHLDKRLNLINDFRFTYEYEPEQIIMSPFWQTIKEAINGIF